MRGLPFKASMALLVCAAVLAGGCNGATCPTSLGEDVGSGVVTIDQGISGEVWFWEGDFMPPGPFSGTVTPVSREMRIHELAGVDDVEPPGYDCFYTAVHTPLAAVVQSDSNGFFEAALEPGEYSIFSVEDTLLYANLFAGGGDIFAVTVEPDEVTSIRFDITYLATY
jgi:hypothetical protein